MTNEKSFYLTTSRSYTQSTSLNITSIYFYLLVLFVQIDYFKRAKNEQIEEVREFHEDMVLSSWEFFVHINR